MIELRTGLPGGGKTLAMVEALARLQARWEHHPEEARPVFIHGIADLALPHCLMPIKQYQTKSNVAIQWVPDWDEMPDGSLVIIDEAQGFFPPRSSQSAPPPHVSWLNTHRHKGFDIWVTTQHPKLIDGGVRALIGKHQHYRRLFGGSRAAVYEFDGCNDSLASLGSAVISYWPYPKKVYKWYKSAEVHTKQKFKLPKWILIPLAGMLMGVYFIPTAFSTLSSGMKGQGLPHAQQTIEQIPVQTIQTAPLPAAAPGNVTQPEVPDTPFTRPEVLAAACMATSTKCRCYTASGTPVAISDAICRRAALENVNFADMQQ